MYLFAIITSNTGRGSNPRGLDKNMFHPLWAQAGKVSTPTPLEMGFSLLVSHVQPVVGALKSTQVWIGMSGAKWGSEELILLCN